MSLFFESILVRNGIPKHLHYHQNRVNRTYRDFYAAPPALDLESEWSMPDRTPSSHDLKARIIYNQNGVVDRSIEIYQRKPIYTLHVKRLDDAQKYPFKSTNRTWIDESLIDLPEDADVLYERDGLILESSFTNIALLKNRVWYTPSQPIHRGTTLERFIAMGHLTPVDIHLAELADFEEIRLFNALLGWGRSYRFRHSDIMT